MQNNKNFWRKIAACLNWDGTFANFFQRMEWLTPLILLALSIWGIAAIFSSGSLEESTLMENAFARKQLIFIIIGWCAYWAVSFIDYRIFRRYAVWIYMAGIALLLPVAFCALSRIDLPGIIEARNGARRWIAFGSYTLQPSEIAKITTLIMLGTVINRGVVWGNLKNWERAFARILWAFIPTKIEGKVPFFLPLVIRVTWLSFLPFLLIFVQPDLTSSIIFVPMAFALLFIANTPLRFFAFIGALVLPFAVLLTVDMTRYGMALTEYAAAQTDPQKARDPATGIRKTFDGGILPLRNYQRERIMALVNRSLIDPDGTVSSWQATQGKLALARGGVSGQGFQNGMLVRLGYLPEAAAHNDFIFSCIGEESGFIGGCSIIGLFGLLIGMTLRTAAKARDQFGSAIAIGVAVITALHVVINIGMNIGMLPVTGVSLPLLSYGGSFALSCFLLFGLVQSVYRSSYSQIKNDTGQTDLAMAPMGNRTPV